MNANRTAAGLASLARRAMAARGVLMMFLMVELVAVIVLAIRLYGELTYSFFDFTFWAAPLAGLISVVLLIVGVVCVPLWTWRAYANLHELGLDGLNFSPAWASLSFFVPIASLFVPFQAMRELYNRSHGEEAHFAAVSVDGVNAWWTAWLVGNFVGSFLAFTQSIGPMTGIYVVTAPAMLVTLQLFSAALAAVAAFFLHRLIGVITRAQQSGTGVSETFA